MPEDAIASASISCPWLLESDPLIPDRLTAFAHNKNLDASCYDLELKLPRTNQRRPSTPDFVSTNESAAFCFCRN